MRNVAIVDDDEVIRNLVSNYLGRKDVQNIDTFADGESAWKAMQSKDYDLIVLDWKLPMVSGMALFNRIRSLVNYRTTPILVVSGFLEKDDFRLLDEYPCTDLIEKPFTNGIFYSKTEELLHEAEWYVDNSVGIAATIETFKGQPDKILSGLKKVIKDAPNPIPLSLVASKALTNVGKDKEAANILESLVKSDDRCIMALNELGKIYLRLGRHKSAADLLRIAHKSSPQNVERLCMMGEAELNLKDPDEAKKYFSSAMEIDSENKTAKSGVVVATNMAEIINVPEAVEISGSFASVLNTIGIGLVRKGNFERGIEQYVSAMAFLHSEVDSSRLAFNLGLGFLRWGKLEKALAWFRKSQELGKAEFGRSAAFIKKLENRLSVIEANRPDLSLIPDGIEQEEESTIINEKEPEVADSVDFAEEEGLGGSITDDGNENLDFDIEREEDDGGAAAA
jgi:CheY-like chemotaxis protein